MYGFLYDYYKMELRSARKTGVDKKAHIGCYLSKVKLRVIGYVQNSMLRRCDMQAGATCAWIDSRIVQLGYLSAASCRWIAAGFQITIPEFVACKKNTTIVKNVKNIYIY